MCFVVGFVNRLQMWYEGTPKYLGESVTGMKCGLRKRWRGLDASIEPGTLVMMLEDMQTNYGTSCVHPQWFSCQKIIADDCDVMK